MDQNINSSLGNVQKRHGTSVLLGKAVAWELLPILEATEIMVELAISL